MKNRNVTLDTNLIVSIFFFVFLLLNYCTQVPVKSRSIENFCKDWKFYLGDVPNDQPRLVGEYDESAWRTLTLPHRG
jgi:hypothetical protein